MPIPPQADVPAARRFAPGTPRPALLGMAALLAGVVVLLFVAGQLSGTRAMLGAVEQDPDRFWSDEWSMQERVRLWSAALAFQDRSRPRRARPVRSNTASVTASAPESVPTPPRRPDRNPIILAALIVTLLLSLLVSIWVLLFLFAPLTGRFGKRWLSPRMQRLRWAVFGAAGAAVAFAVPEAHHLTRLSLFLQQANLNYHRPVEPYSYWEAYWPTLSSDLQSWMGLAVLGLLIVVGASWAADFRQSRRHRVSDEATAAPQSSHA